MRLRQSINQLRYFYLVSFHKMRSIAHDKVVKIVSLCEIAVREGERYAVKENVVSAEENVVSISPRHILIF